MPSITVLVVEDEFLIRLSIVDHLERLGFVVLEAASAAEAVEVLEVRRDVQLVFTDVQMPGTMDGLELAHCIRKRWPPTAIIICSGNKQPCHSELPTDAQWLSKPYNDETFETALASAKRWLTLGGTI